MTGSRHRRRPCRRPRVAACQGGRERAPGHGRRPCEPKPWREQVRTAPENTRRGETWTGNSPKSWQPVPPPTRPHPSLCRGQSWAVVDCAGQLVGGDKTSPWLHPRARPYRTAVSARVPDTTLCPPLARVHSRHCLRPTRTAPPSDQPRPCLGPERVTASDARRTTSQPQNHVGPHQTSIPSRPSQGSALEKPVRLTRKPGRQRPHGLPADGRPLHPAWSSRASPLGLLALGGISRLSVPRAAAGQGVWCPGGARPHGQLYGAGSSQPRGPRATPPDPRHPPHLGAACCLCRWRQTGWRRARPPPGPRSLSLSGTCDRQAWGSCPLPQTLAGPRGWSPGSG